MITHTHTYSDARDWSEGQEQLPGVRLFHLRQAASHSDTVHAQICINLPNPSVQTAFVWPEEPYGTRVTENIPRAGHGNACLLT